MWYYGYGWWILFLVVFFFLPLGYGWGYRGWGPWYRRGGSANLRRTDLPPNAGPPNVYADTGWGWAGVALWVVLLVALIWFIAALGWGAW